MKQTFLPFFLLLCSFGATAQNLIKIAPSLLINYHGFDEKVYLNIGGEIAYEFSLPKKQSIHIAGTAHYGEHKNEFAEDITQKNLLIGVQSEYRFHFDGLYKGAYIGAGFDAKHLTSKNFFPPTPNDPVPTLVNWELNLGLSYGGYFRISEKLYYNPFVYLGFNPSDQNEYTIHCKIGLSIGLKSGKKVVGF